MSTVKSQQYSHSDLRRYCGYFDRVAEVDFAQRPSLDKFVTSLSSLFPLLDKSFFSLETLESGASLLERMVEDHIGLQHSLTSRPKPTVGSTTCAPFFLECSSPVLKLQNLSKDAGAQFLDCWFLLDSTSMLCFCLEQLQFGDPLISDHLLLWLDAASAKKTDILFDLVSLGPSRIRNICVSCPKFSEIICRNVQKINSTTGLSNRNQKQVIELTRLLANCGLLRSRTH
ncbi:hypothetical protein AAHC03_0314 [Spirometra sp. Aus1]